MTSPTTIEGIQAYLSQALLEAHRRFEALLTKALNIYDFAQIRRLVMAAEPFLADNPLLAQWCTYARGLLALEDQQRPAEAITYFESLRAERERLPPNLPVRVLNSLGIAYEKNEQWDQAMRCYQECIEVCEAEKNDLWLGKAFSNLAIVHYKGLDFEAAASHAERGISILGQNPDRREWQIPLARAWNELGMIQMQLGHLEEALAAFEQYLAISTRWNYLFGQGIAYDNLAHTYRQLGDAQKAEAYYVHARDISLKADNPFEAAEAIYGQGQLRMQTQALDKAETLFDEALTLARTTNNYEIITQIFLSRADLQERLGNSVAALAENRQAVAEVESLRANIALPEARIRLQGSRIEAYEQMVARLCQSTSSSDYAEAFRYAEMAKSRALIEMLAGRPLRHSENVPSEWLEKEAQLRQSLRQLYEDSAAERHHIASLEAELDQLRQRIRLRDAEFESFQTVAPLSLDEIMARLPADGVLLEYFTTGDTILTFVITPTEIGVVHLPLRLKELQRAFARTDDGKLHQLRHLTRDQDHRLRQPWILNKLCQTLLQPLGEIIWSSPLLCVVPHGLLHYVPFHALYQKIGSGQRYLLEDRAEPRQIIYAPSATTLFDYCQHKTPSSQAGCLAIGYNDPALNLTQAEMEARRIAQITDGESWTGATATRSSLFEKGANYRYLHFSCHGWFNPTWPSASSLSLADGPLDVTDILHGLRLDADLVSLSACETGRSHILRGDELIGLMRAFLYAGTPSVMASHWLVDELSTRLFMERFYQEVIACSNQKKTKIGAKAEAMGQAQSFIRNLTFDELRQLLLTDKGTAEDLDQQLQHLATSAGYDSIENLRGDECLLAHPYYWAPFFLVGDRLIGLDSRI